MRSFVFMNFLACVWYYVATIEGLENSWLTNVGRSAMIHMPLLRDLRWEGRWIAQFQALQVLVMHLAWTAASSLHAVRISSLSRATGVPRHSGTVLSFGS